MARFEINQKGLDQLLGDIDKKVRAAQAKGEKAAAGKGPDQIAESVARELRKIGVQPDMRVLRDEYRKASGASD